MTPLFSLPIVISQINASGSVEGNWFVGLIILVMSALLVWQVGDMKSSIKENTAATKQLQIDMGIVKHKLGIK